MDEESVTDTESESKSESESEYEFDSESSDDYGENSRKQGIKRKMRMKTPNKKKHANDVSERALQNLSKYFNRTAENKSELPVTCGRKEGTLCVEKYENGEKCIFSQDQWFLPSEFEKFGEKERNKKWKSSICCDGIPLQKFIENECLSGFQQKRESAEQTDRDGLNSVHNLTSNEFLNSSSVPESWKRLFSKTPKVSLLRNESYTQQKETTEQDSSSDESVYVAKRVKTKRRESLNSIKTPSESVITEGEESTVNDGDGTASPAAAPEPDSSVLEEADVRDEGDETSFSAPPAEWQNPVDPEETQTGQTQLLSFLADQFNSLHNTLKSIDSSLKKLLESQSQSQR